ncbi:MAG TPA: zf-HC2 domain-containing protein [Gemmatimonadaceae bacterium]|nr:zf-HC2 domain-containing protein [Gemmatimonadaceae bacterium]
MSNPTLTCEQFADVLADFLERDVAEATRAAMETHALGCAECGPLLADLRRLRIDAANLPELVPSRDLWPGVAARIETPVVNLASRNATSAAAPNRRRVPRGAWLGLAAAGLVAVTATVTHQLTKQSLETARPGIVTAQRPDTTRPQPTFDSGTHVAAKPNTTSPNVPLPATTQSQPTTQYVLNTARSKLTAEQTYGAEIASLLVVYDKKRSELDTTTVAVLQKNLAIIDDAIAQCRLALRKDPASRFLMQSLNDALDTKIQLLRTATMLPSRT